MPARGAETKGAAEARDQRERGNDQEAAGTKDRRLKDYV
jgi:hypothetical protein